MTCVARLRQNNLKIIWYFY